MSVLPKLPTGELLNPGEALIDLGWRGLRLLQRRDFFNFSADSLALAQFVGPEPSCRRLIELGSGNGGLLLLLWALNPQASCTGLEIMPANVALARRSLQINGAVPGLLAGCRFVQGDWRTPWLYFAPQSFDLLVSNPPYRPVGSGRLSPVPERAAAKWELFGNLAGLLKSACWLLRPGGSLALVLPASRREEALELLAAAGFVQQRQQRAGKLVLLAAEKPIKSQ